jgi:adenylate cyclase
MGNLDATQHDAAWDQLKRIVACPAFSGAPRLSSLLRYIVTETLAGRGDQLKEYKLGVEALDRASSFDPRLDSIVRVEASKLRSRLAAYYKGAGADDPVLMELPRGSYAVRITSRERSGEPLPVGTVAVLPFVNHGPDTDAEYLADGLTEELIDRLGAVPAMRVVARTSAFQFKANAGNIREIGRVLGARYVIEGSIRKSAQRLRVNARLIDAESGYQLWSRSFDETIDDVFGVQITIAAAIGAAFGAHLPVQPATTGQNRLGTHAYQAYLRGRFHRSQWTMQSFDKSIECFQVALASEPNSPTVLGALSEASTMRAMLGDLAPAEHLASAREAAQRAIAMDEACAHAHLSLGWIHHLYHWQWESGQAEFERAVQLNPSFAEAYHLKGIFLALRRRVPEAEASFAKALELDPLSLVIRTHTAIVPYFSGNFRDAESRLGAAIDMDPRFPEAHWMLGLTYDSQGNYRSALEEFQRAIDLGGENPTLIADTAFVHIRLGELQAAHGILARLENGFPRPHPAASSVARIYLALGEREKSNTWLEEAFESRDAMLPWACSDTRYQDLWTLPSFSDFRRRMIAEPVR